MVQTLQRDACSELCWAGSSTGEEGKAGQRPLFQGNQCPAAWLGQSETRAPASGSPASISVLARFTSASPDLAVGLLRGVLQGEMLISLLQTMPTFGHSYLSRPFGGRQNKDGSKVWHANRCLPLYL